MMNIVITIPDLKDSTVIIKLNKDLEDVNPVNIMAELKDLIEGREKVIKPSELRVYFDKELLSEIRQNLAVLLAYYVIEGINNAEVQHS